MGLLAACKYIVALVILAPLMFLGKIKYDVATYHTSKFNSENDRQGVVQLIVEGLEVVDRNREQLRKWARELPSDYLVSFTVAYQVTAQIGMRLFAVARKVIPRD